LGAEFPVSAGKRAPANKSASKLELTVENKSDGDSPDPFFTKAESRQSEHKSAELTLADKAPGIRERSASSRASARSVFAAKQQGSGKRRRQMLALGAAAAVVLLLLAGGLLMMLNTDSGSGITVPDNYVANQSQSELFDQGSVQQELSGAANFDEADLDEPEQTVSLTDSDGNSTVRFTTLATLPAETSVSAPMPVVDTVDPVDSVDPVDPVEQAALSANPAQIAAAPALASASGDSNNTDQAPAEEALADAGDVTPTASDSNDPEAAGSAVQPQSDTEAPAAAVAQINFTRRQADSTLQPLLNEAYTAYQRGDLGLARQRYQAALADSPMHRDALLGLAAIAVAEQQPAQAMDYYSRMLARNPADPVARAALLELSPAGGPATQERELRRLLDLHPQVASLAYAMGNFYASRQQWSDAQQYYFRALQLARSQAEGPEQMNPDYAYNLAVSLEHLNQARAAIPFYQEALTQAQSQQAGFDLNGARRRVETLSRTLTP
jgi:tetratricopeptide (TPR) repeat protein